MNHNTHEKKVRYAGNAAAPGGKALILLHGRGSNAADILGLAQHLDVSNFTLAAPEASNHTWYPYSFLAAPAQNEPWLSSALALVKEIVGDLEDAGISAENIYILGFSQGACLGLEFAARNATRYGGVIAFTGGLIGDRVNRENYTGNFEGTPVYIGTSDTDPHVPVNRVYATENILKEMGASVTASIFPNMPHTIIAEEIKAANQLLNNGILK